MNDERGKENIFQKWKVYMESGASEDLVLFLKGLVATCENETRRSQEEALLGEYCVDIRNFSFRPAFSAKYGEFYLEIKRLLVKALCNLRLEEMKTRCNGPCPGIKLYLYFRNDPLFMGYWLVYALDVISREGLHCDHQVLQIVLHLLCTITSVLPVIAKSEEKNLWEKLSVADHDKLVMFGKNNFSPLLTIQAMRSLDEHLVPKDSEENLSDDDNDWNFPHEKIPSYGYGSFSGGFLFDSIIVPSYFANFENICRKCILSKHFSSDSGFECDEHENGLSFCTSLLLKLCDILTNMLGNKDMVTFFLEKEELFGKLFNLLVINISGYPYYFVLQRKLLRCFAALMLTATLNISILQKLHGVRAFQQLVLCLKYPTLPASIRTELCQVILGILKSSTNLSSLLYEQFLINNGYAGFSESLVLVDRKGSLLDKQIMVITFVSLLFIGPTPLAPEESLVTNDISGFAGIVGNGNRGIKTNMFNFDPMFHENNFIPSEALREVLRVLAAVESEEMKAYILEIIQCTFNQFFCDPARSRPGSVLDSLMPFKLLFLQFQSFSLMNKMKILGLFDQVLRKGRFTSEEIRAYVQVFDCARPSIVILLSHHCRNMLEFQVNMTLPNCKSPKVSCALNDKKLLDAGLLTVLLGYLTTPSDLRSSKFSIIDEKEIAISNRIINDHEDCQNKDLEGIDVHPRSAKVLENSHLDNRTKVLYYSIMTIMDLLRIFLEVSPEARVRFHELAGLKKLFALLVDPILIDMVLDIIVFFAEKSFNLEARIIPDLLSALQASGGSASMNRDIFLLRSRILGSISIMCKCNDKFQHSFRESGGFIWFFSVLDGIGRALQQPNPFESDDCFCNDIEVLDYLLSMLSSLKAIIRGNEKNLEYLRDDIEFSTIASVLHRLRLPCPQDLEILCSALLTIAIKGSWPLNCSESHCGIEKNKKTVYCTKCMDAMQLEIPEIIKLVVLDVLPVYNSNCFGESIVCILNSIISLTSALFSNQYLMSSNGFVRGILQNYSLTSNYIPKSPETKDIIYPGCINTGSELPREENCVLSPDDSFSTDSILISTLLDLLELCSYSMDVNDLMEWLRQTKNYYKAPLLFQRLIKIASRPKSPSYFFHFCSNGIQSIRIDVDNHKFPNRGYSFGFWFCVERFPDPSGSIELFSLHEKSGKSICISVDHGIVSLCCCDNVVSFSSFRFEIKKWYFCVVSHEYQTIKNSSDAKAIVRLFVNGLHRSIGYIPYPNNADWNLDTCILGNSVNPDKEASWLLGNSLFFESSLKDDEVFLLFRLGPDFAKDFNVDLTLYETFDCIYPETVLFHRKSLDCILYLEKCTTGHLNEKLVFLMCVRNIVVAHAVKSNLFSPSLSRSLAPRTLLPFYPTPILSPSFRGRRLLDNKKLQNVVSQDDNVNVGLRFHSEEIVVKTSSVSSVLKNCGGVSLLIHLIALAKEKDFQFASLQLLYHVLQEHWALREMLCISGYEIIARLMRKKYWVLDCCMGSLVLSFVSGCLRSHHDECEKSCDYKVYFHNVIVNTRAFKSFILDWSIWSRASTEW